MRRRPALRIREKPDRGRVNDDPIEPCCSTLDDFLHPAGRQARHGIAIGASGKQQTESICHVRNAQRLQFRRLQALAQAARGQHAEHFRNGRPAKVGVDQQHAAFVGFAQREREVHRGQRLALGGLSARQHDDLDAALDLRLVQNAGEPAIGLRRRLHVEADHRSLITARG